MEDDDDEQVLDMATGGYVDMGIDVLNLNHTLVSNFIFYLVFSTLAPCIDACPVFRGIPHEELCV